MRAGGRERGMVAAVPEAGMVSTCPNRPSSPTCLRTKPIDAGIESSVCGPDFAIRRRLDGGYTVAHGNAANYDITPDTFRLMKTFWPAFKMEQDKMRIRFGSALLRSVGRDRLLVNEFAETPFEKKRVWDPNPQQDHSG